jgi:late competence protein required for DNA uptake (superfamily II DNA/RNA helicase)
MDIQILDDGTALASITFKDAKGNAIAAPAGASVSYQTSDPNVSVAANSDGMTATLTPTGTLVTGVTVTAVATLADGKTQFTDTALVDVVGDAAKPNGISLAITPSN